MVTYSSHYKFIIKFIFVCKFATPIYGAKKKTPERVLTNQMESDWTNIMTDGNSALHTEVWIEEICTELNKK